MLYTLIGIASYILGSMISSYTQKTICNIHIIELKNVPWNMPNSNVQPPIPYTCFPPHNYPIKVSSVDMNEEGIYDIPLGHEELSVKAVPLEHTVPCVGYLIEEKKRKGKLNQEYVKEKIHQNQEALKELGIPEPKRLYQTIKNMKSGEKLELPDGTVIALEEGTSEQTSKELKVAILGDNSNMLKMKELAQDCDFLYHEATNVYLNASEEDSKQELKKSSKGENSKQEDQQTGDEDGSNQPYMTQG